MKKTLILLAALCLAVSVTGCGSTTNKATDNQTTTSQAAVSTPTEAPTEAPVAQETNKGTVNGMYDVEIVSARTANDYQGSPAIIVTYNFTNNGDKNISFLTAVGAKAFQNSVECGTAVMMPGDMDAQPSLAQVQPGGTLAVECAYSLQDLANPVTVQVGPFVNVNGTVNAQMVFNLQQ